MRSVALENKLKKINIQINILIAKRAEGEPDSVKKRSKVHEHQGKRKKKVKDRRVIEAKYCT